MESFNCRESCGYKLSMFSSCPKKCFLCALCCLVLRKPVQSFCGHRFCEGCIDGFLRSRPHPVKCPACEKDEPDSRNVQWLDKTKIKPDMGTVRDMYSLTTFCPFHNCKWKGEFRDFIEVHEGVCEHRRVQCGREITMKSDNQKTPLSMEHSVRLKKCRYCPDSFVAKDVQAHNADCPKFPVRCQYCTTMPKSAREKILAHQNSGMCQKTHMPCSFGCKELIRVSESDKHMKENVVSHLNAIHKRIQVLEAVKRQTQRLEHATIRRNDRYDKVVQHLTILLYQLEDIEARFSALQDRAQLGNGVLGQRFHVKESAEETGCVNLSNRVAAMLGNVSDCDKYALQESKLSTIEATVAVLNREVIKCSSRLQMFEDRGRISKSDVKQCDDGIKNLERQIKRENENIAAKDFRLDTLELGNRHPLHDVHFTNRGFCHDVSGGNYCAQCEKLTNPVPPSDPPPIHRQEFLNEQDPGAQNKDIDGVDGTLAWKIKDFSKRQLDVIKGNARSLYSPHFVSGIDGYKMRCRIYPNGDEMSFGTHLSLYLLVVEGENDKALKWPFEERVTLKVLDQRNRDYIVKTFQPMGHVRNSPSEMNLAYGFSEFCPLNRLRRQSDNIPHYLHNDILFVKVLVD